MGAKEISRRRMLGTLGAGAMGVAGAPIAGGLLGSAAQAGPLPVLPEEPQASEAVSSVAPDGAQPAEFKNPLTERFEMTYPIIQAGFSAFYVTPQMVAAVSNADGLGCLGAVPEGPEGVRNMIRATKALTSRPFGIDYVYFPLYGATVWSPDYEESEHPTREVNWTCTDDHIDVVVEEQLPFVVFFWTSPEVRWVKKLQGAGIEVWMQVGDVDEARQAVDMGLDGIVATGHAGRWAQPGLSGGKPASPV